MERVARLPDAERAALFAETAARLKMTPAVAEKDFWVTWALDRLFADAELGRLLMFKGGTSLSKVYRLADVSSPALCAAWASASGRVICTVLIGVSISCQSNPWTGHALHCYRAIVSGYLGPGYGPAATLRERAEAFVGRALAPGVAIYQNDILATCTSSP